MTPDRSQENPNSFSIKETLDSFSFLNTEQVMYTSQPPALTEEAIFDRIVLCNNWYPLTFFASKYTRFSGARPQVPEPEQGTSATTISNSPEGTNASGFPRSMM